MNSAEPGDVMSRNLRWQYFVRSLLLATFRNVRQRHHQHQQRFSLLASQPFTFVESAAAPNNITSRQQANQITHRIFFNNGGVGLRIWSSTWPTQAVRPRTWRRRFGINNTGFPLAGFLAELGFGVRADFVRSGATDGLDFDPPDRDPAPQSVRFPTLVHDPDTLRWSGAVVSIGQIGASFAIDVPDELQNFHPDGLNRFTVRLTPLAVPEPSYSVLLLAGLSLLALRMRHPSKMKSAR
jgi:hypothetical protein